MRRLVRIGSVFGAVALAVGSGLAIEGAWGPGATPPVASISGVVVPEAPPSDSAASDGALAGRTIVLDPGHQLGNRSYPRLVGRLVSAGGFRKACNTTGTATAGGFTEASFNFRVAVALRTRLQDLGARVIMTRTTNRQDRWGPCVDARGRAGNAVGADLKISIHGDGRAGAGPGFHVIAPTDRRPWTHDIHAPSKRLAGLVRASLRAERFPVAPYVAGGSGLDLRADLGTLNLSNVPTVIVECGNMRNATDARRMGSAAGQARYAAALARASTRFLG